MIYLCNAFSVNMLSPMWVTEDKTVRIERISAREAGELLTSSKWESYFGHSSSAWHLSRYIHADVHANRGTFSLKPGDILIVAAAEGRRRPDGRKSGCPGWRFFKVTIEAETFREQENAVGM